MWKKIDVSGLGQLTISEFEQIFKDEEPRGLLGVATMTHDVTMMMAMMMVSMVSMGFR